MTLKAPMTISELEDKLLTDLKSLNIEGDFSLVIKKFSKSYLGKYNPNNNKLFLYVYPSANCKYMYSYDYIFKNFLHEVSHYLQYKDPKFKRVKGVMHNEDFYKRYNNLVNSAYTKRIIRR